MIDEEKLRFEKKDPLWIEFHALFDAVEKRVHSLDIVFKKMFNLSYVFLNKYSKKEDLKEIIVAFENLKNNVFANYGAEAAEQYESDDIGKILEGFDSLIFNYDYMKEITELKILLKVYLDNLKND